MREQRQGLYWILSCLKNLRLMWGCIKDLCCCLFFQHWRSMLSLNLREGMLCELLYADDLVLMSETVEGISDSFLKWKEAFEIKCLKVSLGKPR